MFKVLIADDEIFTREGIIEQIPWDELGVSEVRQAFDGLDALEIASTFSPDILLTDVRMPRMDGVQLSFRLRDMLPSCEIIFMSGYSDKEYLKAAIKLKAVSYVEKPIDIEELQVSLKNAIGAKSKSMQTNKNMKKQLALELTEKDLKIDDLKDTIDAKLYNKLMQSNFVTLIISFIGDDEFIKEDILSNVEKLIEKNGYESICSFIDDKRIVVHIFWIKNKLNLSKDKYLHQLFSAISDYLSSYTNFFIAVGKKVPALGELSKSYKTSMDAMSECFYYYHNSIIYYSEHKTSIYQSEDNLFNNFYDKLISENKQECLLTIKRLTCDIKQNTATPVNYIKDIYYRLFLKLTSFASERNLGVSDNDLSASIPFEKFLEFNTIYDTEAYVTDKIETIFNYMAQKSTHDNPVSSVLDYIHKNYDNLDLSLQKISENTYLTTAYICTIFKNKTGMTVNKYILEYRLNEAKKLLKDRTMKINEIASKVGYGDGNYFTKIFRKDTGLTPSEYRQKFFS
ncbi:response regulator [Clostridium oryzae]|uniref:Stage 0 sporulation protein A homolog n=1 Tax=Clostridium oryzae TaxID=1450648 RepID=A0A1V4IPL7_9CLOT|nr:response regulator [Clostridium oryzae]OPJ61952.1 putative response regulatory protein [Clostridium oryzae]